MRDDERADDTVTVRISNTYVCGRQSGAHVDVPSPRAPDDLDAWWDQVVLPETGDGHPCGARENAVYEAVVIAAPGDADLIGRSRSWTG